MRNTWCPSRSSMKPLRFKPLSTSRALRGILDFLEGCPKFFFQLACALAQSRIVFQRVFPPKQAKLCRHSVYGLVACFRRSFEAELRHLSREELVFAVELNGKLEWYTGPSLPVLSHERLDRKLLVLDRADIFDRFDRLRNAGLVESDRSENLNQFARMLQQRWLDRILVAASDVPSHSEEPQGDVPSREIDLRQFSVDDPR